MSRITFTVSTVPACANRSCRSLSPVSYGRFPTYSLRPISTHSYVAHATLVEVLVSSLGGISGGASGRDSLRSKGSTALARRSPTSEHNTLDLASADDF